MCHLSTVGTPTIKVTDPASNSNAIGAGTRVVITCEHYTADIELKFYKVGVQVTSGVAVVFNVGATLTIDNFE